ncbi:MAG: hypothetical protein CMQ44_06520 [Gammaproteobacteria bacterium]|nr:hypothetical protein [Gammaproteobacteria bacterium]|tara:strand:+ start:6602 stop:7405 length:804 start_codon:yes stop_codon:yes gene_type:complete
MKTWSATALNTAPDSENRIHSDELAQEYGFEGGLVPGVTISAYLVHPLVELWGKDWLDKGYANCRITSPLYDEELFDVKTDMIDSTRANTTLVRGNGIVSANAEVALTEALPPAPRLRKDKLADRDYAAPQASRTVWEQLKAEGCRSFSYSWPDDDPVIYLTDENLLPTLLQPKVGGYANLSFLLGCSNWILAANAFMNPWVHLQTISQNYRAVSLNSALIAQMEINKIYEKKGHEFIDVFVNLFDQKDEMCVMTINLTAIYKLRGS